MRIFSLLPKGLSWLIKLWIRGHWALRFMSPVFELIPTVGTPNRSHKPRGRGPTDLPPSAWPHRTDRPCGIRKNYEFWHPVVTGTGIFSQFTVLDTLKTFMIHENSFFRGTLWLCFGPRNKLATMNSLEEWFPHHIALPSEDNGFAQCGKGEV